jgi:hypothetical protein
MMIDLGWIVGWILAGAGAYYSGAPCMIMVAGIFIAHISALVAIRAEMPRTQVEEP